MTTNKPSYIDQSFVDNMFSSIDGHGYLTYVLEDCEFIQKTLKEEFDIFLSINECRRFWEWRSQLWDGTFLSVNNKEEVLEFFLEYVRYVDLEPEYVKELTEKARQNGK